MVAATGKDQVIFKVKTAQAFLKQSPFQALTSSVKPNTWFVRHPLILSEYCSQEFA